MIIVNRSSDLVRQTLISPLCSNDWGEFTLRIKIVFKNAKTPSLNEVYRLDLHSLAKKKVDYKCPWNLIFINWCLCRKNFHTSFHDNSFPLEPNEEDRLVHTEKDPRHFFLLYDPVHPDSCGGGFQWAYRKFCEGRTQ